MLVGKAKLPTDLYMGERKHRGSLPHRTIDHNRTSSSFAKEGSLDNYRTGNNISPLEKHESGGGSGRKLDRRVTGQNSMVHKRSMGGKISPLNTRKQVKLKQPVHFGSNSGELFGKQPFVGKGRNSNYINVQAEDYI